MEKVYIEFPLKHAQRLNESEAVSLMMRGLNKLRDFGALTGDTDKFLLDYQFKDNKGYAVAIIDRSAIQDASKLNSIGASFVPNTDRVILELENEDALQLEKVDRQFSAATIQERIRLAGLDPKVRFRSIVMDYKRYWKSQFNKIKSNPLLANRIKNMFVLDLTGIFSEILPYIQEGKQLSALTGLNNVTDGLNSVSRDLSTAYRRALQQAKGGQLGKSALTGLQANYSRFMNLLIPQIFPGIETIIGVSKKSDEEGKSKEFSQTASKAGILTITAEEISELKSLMDAIKEALESGDCTVTLKDSDKDVQSFSFKKDVVKISSISSKQTASVNYSYTKEGRIKLFE